MIKKIKGIWYFCLSFLQWSLSLNVFLDGHFFVHSTINCLNQLYHTHFSFQLCTYAAVLGRRTIQATQFQHHCDFDGEFFAEIIRVDMCRFSNRKRCVLNAVRHVNDDNRVILLDP